MASMHMHPHYPTLSAARIDAQAVTQQNLIEHTISYPLLLLEILWSSVLCMGDSAALMIPLTR